MTSPTAGANVDEADPRFAALDAVIRHMGRAQDTLIEVLHRAQKLFGRLDPVVLMHVARGLRLPPSRVYGTASFYHLFRFAPKGKHSCVVCVGTACHLLGGGSILHAVEKVAGVRHGATTADGEVSVDTVRCVGTCGLAPLVVVDGKVMGGQRLEDVSRLVEGWCRRES